MRIKIAEAIIKRDSVRNKLEDMISEVSDTDDKEFIMRYDRYDNQLYELDTAIEKIIWNTELEIDSKYMNL